MSDMILSPYNYPLFKTQDSFLLDAYTGQGGFATGWYLVRHLRESDEKFYKRQLLAVYPNYVRKIVDVYMGFLWKQSPNRETDAIYAAFLTNADGSGTKLDSLLYVYQRLAIILGTVYVIVDKPQQQGPTRADQQYPFLALRLKSQLVHEEKDGSGAWTMVRFVEVVNKVTLYRTFTKDGWEVSKKSDGTDVIESGAYNLGRVPVVRLHSANPVNPTDTNSQSFVYDLAGLNWDIYNMRSELRDLFRAQTFSILTLPVVDDSERERLKDLTIGADNALTFNPNGGGKPSFVAPPSDPITLYREQIADTVEAIYKVASLEFVGGVQLSGTALSFQFQNCNSNLFGMAEMCETAECEIAQLVYAWQDSEFDGNISYPSDFNLSDLKQSLDIALDTVSMGMGSEFDKAIKKRLARHILGNDIAPSPGDRRARGFVCRSVGTGGT